MKYMSTKTYQDVEIDLATASLDALLDAYNSLFAQSDTGGAYPGSKAWQAGQKYTTQLRALIAARPEIEQYRNDLITAKNAERVAKFNPFTN